MDLTPDQRSAAPVGRSAAATRRSEKSAPPSAIAIAEGVANAKAAELAAAKEEVSRLSREHGEALVALRAARVDADAALPRCRLVSRRWRSDKMEEAGMLVLLRKTPGGMLVARRVGEPSGSEYKFKWIKHIQTYRNAARQISFASATLELRDVPPEYMPVGSPTRSAPA